MSPPPPEQAGPVGGESVLTRWLSETAIGPDDTARRRGGFQSLRRLGGGLGRRLALEDAQVWHSAPGLDELQSVGGEFGVPHG